MLKGLVRGSLPVFVSLVGALLPLGAVGPLPTVASAAQRSDPAMGPHTRDEAQHRADVLSLAPARPGVIPRPLAGQGRVGAAVRPNALAPAGGGVRGGFGFAPH